jgi:hypothetical protein
VVLATAPLGGFDDPDDALSCALTLIEADGDRSGFDGYAVRDESYGW